MLFSKQDFTSCLIFGALMAVFYQCLISKWFLVIIPQYYLKMVSYVVILQRDYDRYLFYSMYSLTILYLAYCHDIWWDLISRRLYARLKKDNFTSNSSQRKIKILSLVYNSSKTSRKKFKNKMEGMPLSEYQKHVQHHTQNIYGVKNFKAQMEAPCNFCLGPKRLPVLVSRCDHIFCSGCFIEYIKSRQDQIEQKRWFESRNGQRYECPVCRQGIHDTRGLYKLKKKKTLKHLPNWLPNEFEREITKIHLEIKHAQFLDQLHQSFMNEWESFLYLFLSSENGKNLLNNFTVSIWLSEVLSTFGNEFFLSGNFAPVFRLLVLLFTFASSLYLIHTLATEIFSKVREGFHKRKRKLLKIKLLPRLTICGMSGYLCLCFVRGLFPNLEVFLVQILVTVIGVLLWLFEISLYEY